jgi:hypothetical protein
MDTVLKGKPAAKLLQPKHVQGKDGEGQSPAPKQPSNPPDGNGNGNGQQPCVPPNCQPTDPGQANPSPSRRRVGG